MTNSDEVRLVDHRDGEIVVDDELGEEIVEIVEKLPIGWLGECLRFSTGTRFLLALLLGLLSGERLLDHETFVDTNKE